MKVYQTVTVCISVRVCVCVCVYVCVLCTITESMRAGMAHSNTWKWQQKHNTLMMVMMLEKMR